MRPPISLDSTPHHRSTQLFALDTVLLVLFDPREHVEKAKLSRGHSPCHPHTDRKKGRASGWARQGKPRGDEI